MIVAGRKIRVERSAKSEGGNKFVVFEFAAEPVPTGWGPDYHVERSPNLLLKEEDHDLDDHDLITLFRVAEIVAAYDVTGRAWRTHGAPEAPEFDTVRTH